MFCRKCGSELVSGSKYCGKCGYQTLEWEQQSAQQSAQQTQVVQPVQPVTPSKNNYTLIIVLILVFLFVIFVLPFFLILFIIIIFIATTTYESYSNDFEYSSIIHVGPEEIPTLLDLDYDPIICYSEGNDYGDHVYIEYCGGEVTDRQIDNYEKLLKDEYDFTYNIREDYYYKKLNKGRIVIKIEDIDDIVSIDYLFEEKYASANEL